jgi:hypothetical protein
MVMSRRGSLFVVVRCIEVVPMVALFLVFTMIMRGWVNQGYFPEDPYVGDNDRVIGRLSPRTVYPGVA